MTRTIKFLSACFLFLFSLFSFSYSHGQTAGGDKVYVIVHGAWGGSWGFRAVDSILTSRGYKVYRPSLTGLGERVHLSSADLGLETHILDVLNFILFEDLKNVVLVGHSYSGMLISAVADRIPERINHLIYLEAVVPYNGENLMQFVSDKRMSWIKSNIQDGYINPFWVKEGDKTPKDVPQPLKTFTDPIQLKKKHGPDASCTFIFSVDEGSKEEEDICYEFMLRAKKKGCRIYKVVGDHNLQWSQPENLADLITKEP